MVVPTGLTALTSGDKFCENCGTALRAGVEFCGMCGTLFYPEVQPVRRRWTVWSFLKRFLVSEAIPIIVFIVILGIVSELLPSLFVIFPGALADLIFGWSLLEAKKNAAGQTRFSWGWWIGMGVLWGFAGADIYYLKMMPPTGNELSFDDWGLKYLRWLVVMIALVETVIFLCWRIWLLMRDRSRYRG